MKLKYLISSLLILTAGCSSVRQLDESASKKIDNVAYARGNWIKTKGKRFNLEFQLGNLSAENLHFERKTVRCGKGKIQGVVKKFLEGKIEYFDISVAPKTTKVLHVMCEFYQKNISGDFYVNLGTIYKGVDVKEVSEKNTVLADFILSISDPDSATE